MRVLKRAMDNKGNLVRLIMETNIETNWNKFYVEVFKDNQLNHEYLFTLLRPAEKYYHIKLLELNKNDL